MLTYLGVVWYSGGMKELLSIIFFGFIGGLLVAGIIFLIYGYK